MALARAAGSIGSRVAIRQRPDLSRRASHLVVPKDFTPPLHLHPFEDPFPATVRSIRTLRPLVLGKPSPADSDVYEVILDVGGNGSRFVDLEGKLQLYPGHHLHIDARDFNQPLPDERIYRRYSIAGIYLDGLSDGLQSDGNRVRLVIRRVDFTNAEGERQLGVVSNAVAQLNPGELLRVSGPSVNRALMNARKEDDVAIINTGIAAYAPGTLLAAARFAGGTDGIGRTWFFASYRTRTEELNGDLLRSWATDEKMRFKYVPVFSQEGEREHVDAAIVREGPGLLTSLLKDRLCLFMSGLKEVEDVVLQALETAAKSYDVSPLELDRHIARAKLQPETLRELEEIADRDRIDRTDLHRHIARDRQEAPDAIAVDWENPSGDLARESLLHALTRGADYESHRWRVEGVRHRVVSPETLTPAG